MHDGVAMVDGTRRVAVGIDRLLSDYMFMRYTPSEVQPHGPPPAGRAKRKPLTLRRRFGPR